jgi:hypothetical protein
VTASSPCHNYGAGAISAAPKILSGDSLIQCDVVGHQVVEHLIICCSFLVLDRAAGDVHYNVP